MEYRVQMINRHDGSVIEKRVEAPNEKWAKIWGMAKQKRRDFKFIACLPIVCETINFGAPKHVKL